MGLDEARDLTGVFKHRHPQTGHQSPIHRPSRAGKHLERRRPPQRHHPAYRAGQPAGRRAIERRHVGGRTSRHQHQPAAALHPVVDRGERAWVAGDQIATAGEDGIGTVEVTRDRRQRQRLARGDDHPGPTAVLAGEQPRRPIDAGRIPEREQDAFGRGNGWRQREERGGRRQWRAMEEHSTARPTKPHAEAGHRAAVHAVDTGGRRRQPLAIGILNTGIERLFAGRQLDHERSP